jgi:ABC-type Mn2+/Zn2+ transport system ATPase subunit
MTWTASAAAVVSTHAGPTPAVVIEHVSAGYGSRIALSDVSLTVARGSLLAVIGPNGAGKSTLLKAIAGLLRPTDGRLTVLGRAPGASGPAVAYLPQAEEVDWDFPVTVDAVVMMGRYARIGVGRRPGRLDRERIEAAMETVQIADLARRQIGALSGGQRRRVFLARAIAAEPELYLLDEPVTGVDARTQEDLMDVLEGEARRGRTVIATTHDLVCARQRFHDTALLNGRLVAAGRSALALDEALLRETYGGHVLVLPGGAGELALDDAHHDEPRGHWLDHTRDGPR